MKSPLCSVQSHLGENAGELPLTGNGVARTLDNGAKCNRSFDVRPEFGPGLRNIPSSENRDRRPDSCRPLLAAKGLRKQFGGQVVLEEVDLELHQGEVVLLRGENGSGKTTLLNILTGSLEPDTGVIEYAADDSPRTYRFPRRWWQELNPWDHFRPEFVAGEGIGRTWQDIRLFRTQSLRDNIAVATPGQPGENPIWALFTPGRVSRTEKEISAKADAMLARLGLAGRETSSAGKISLGQSKRVAIARAVAAGARILFLDEPLAGLDRPGIANVLGLLEHLVKEQGVTLVVVEHVFNLPQLHGLITTDWLLDNGKIHRSSRQEAAPESNEAHQAHSRGQERPWLALLMGADGATITDEQLPRGAVLTRIRRSKDPSRNPTPALQIRNLIVKRGSRTVVGLDDEGMETGFNLTLFKGEIAVLQAPNGWGKSSLLAAITGLIPQEQGEILLKGHSLVEMPIWKRITHGLRFVPSDCNIFPTLTVNESLRLAGQTSREATLGALHRCQANDLSGGQKQRLALLSEPESTAPWVRMFDEPFANLDSTVIHETAQRILVCSTSAILVALPSTTK